MRELSRTHPNASERCQVPDWDDERAVVADDLRMTELQAALVMDQARALDDSIARQRANRAQLREMLGIDVMSAVVDTEAPELDAGSHTLFLARSASSAQEFCDAVRAEGVPARVVRRKTYPEYGVFRSTAIRPRPPPRHPRTPDPRGPAYRL
ncbi:DegT/DnrJ/EryC1/StrS family aminotransferase [Saccharothrix deserti]|uniref:DegT/DnrJ/EryC1/StrS family aminotransferase n=1 Tax=Saccharothrix deserti TaxID=2593674 RepID=UPI00131A6ED6|nr:DegT/DnrJ/EryC1/StrS family aminotransferase [Saccharothrix deserti]